MAKNENPLQGAFIIEELTDLVEEAVMVEFDSLTERGGVLGAMETMYQRSRIQEESTALRDPEAHGRVPHHRGEHLPLQGGLPHPCAGRGHPRHPGREAGPNRRSCRLCMHSARWRPVGSGPAECAAHPRWPTATCLPS